ncbi:hypothetical protein [Microvirga sp. 2TAF3]|uniref:hypothetical protein n=1 Tax=Microvirga sp. 2TAF3 TaxID=3233014 RepID=UPI003F94B023
MSDESNLFVTLLEEADKFCGHLGVGKDVLLATYKETSDWAFIIKIDALHETACRDLVSRMLTIGGSGDDPSKAVADFVGDMGYQGRSSVLRLIELTGCPKEYIRFLEAVRRVRNAFAHNIRSVNMTLMEMIEQRSERAQLLKTFSAIAEEGYDEAKFLKMMHTRPDYLRFGILHQSMVLLYLMHANFAIGGEDSVEGVTLAD